MVEKRPKTNPLVKNFGAQDTSLETSRKIKLPNPKNEISSNIEYKLIDMEYLPNSASPNLRTIKVDKIKNEIGKIDFERKINILLRSVDFKEDNKNSFLNIFYRARFDIETIPIDKINIKIMPIER